MSKRMSGAGRVAPQASVAPLSMVGSLCREAVWLRARGQQLLQELSVCQSPVLWQRLRREQCRLQERRDELQRISRLIQGARRCAAGSPETLGAALLQEITSRPLVVA